MSDDILIPIVAILMPVVLVPTVMVLRQSARKREWQHRERMKSLELGVPIPGSEAWASRVAIAIGAVMPVCVFAIAWLASLTTRSDDVWVAAAVVGGAGVLGGIRLAGRTISACPRIEWESAETGYSQRQTKPPFNPDAYEAIVRHS